MSQLQHTTTSAPTATALAPRAGLALAAPVIANLAIWAIGDAAVDPIQIPDGDTSTALEWPLVVGITAGGLVAAAVAAYVIGRFIKRPRRIFLAVVAAVTLISLGGPLTADLDTDNIVFLAAMHLVAGAAAAVAFGPTLPERRPS